MLKTFIIGRLSRFARDRRGVSAIEFAFVAPLMIGLYLGCAEISDGVAADRKVSLIAGALANLTAQDTAIDDTEMTNILDASGAIIAPFSASNLTMVLSCLKIDLSGAATVQWSKNRNGAARA
ncbi:MAG: TadE/TadG family type IV pilus assembly protein, partial [Pseudolabrys sp.]